VALNRFNGFAFAFKYSKARKLLKQLEALWASLLTGLKPR
jgi:hypothetical protein